MKHKIITIIRIAILLITIWSLIYISGWQLLLKPFFDLYAAYMSTGVTGMLIFLSVVKVVLAIPSAVVFAWSGYIVQEIVGRYGE